MSYEPNLGGTINHLTHSFRFTKFPLLNSRLKQEIVQVL